MTTFFALLNPRPGLSLEEFHDHWRHPHGTLGATLGAVEGYIQNHRIRPEGVPLPEAGPEGIVRIDLRGGASATDLAGDPVFTRHLAADEHEFLDVARISTFATEMTDMRRTRLGAAPGRISASRVAADEAWSVSTAANAITVIRPLVDAPSQDTAERARHLGATWHATYTVTGSTRAPVAGAQRIRAIEQFWWPTLERLRPATETEQWRDLMQTPDPATVDPVTVRPTAVDHTTVMLAVAERFR